MKIEEKSNNDSVFSSLNICYKEMDIYLFELHSSMHITSLTIDIGRKENAHFNCLYMHVVNFGYDRDRL